MYFTRFQTDLCEIILAGDDKGLRHLHLNTGEGKRKFDISPEWQENTEFFTAAVTQINDYLAGIRKDFDINIAPEGTDFQRRVWRQLQTIAYGETRTYGEIAAELGSPGSSRAVGAANGRNPIPLIIPCHRVIGAGGTLTGYAHGLAAKQRLLDIEARFKQS